MEYRGSVSSACLLFLLFLCFSLTVSLLFFILLLSWGLSGLTVWLEFLGVKPHFAAHAWLVGSFGEGSVGGILRVALLTQI